MIQWVEVGVFLSSLVFLLLVEVGITIHRKYDN